MSDNNCKLLGLYVLSSHKSTFTEEKEFLTHIICLPFCPFTMQNHGIETQVQLNIHNIVYIISFFLIIG